MIFLTFNDPPSGVYTGQVVDVVRFLRAEFGVSIKLVAFISLRNFFPDRKKIKSQLSDAVVLPMFPGLKNWKINKWTLFLLCLVSRPATIIARGIFAANLALELKEKKIIRKVCYDGRGATMAEWEEYDVSGNVQLPEPIEKTEKNAVCSSDFRIAVSQKLVDYWGENFNYSSSEHIIVPCTLSSKFKYDGLSEKESIHIRKELGFEPEDIILVYSGSISGWQSFPLLTKFIFSKLSANPEIKVLILANKEKNASELFSSYPGRVKIKWVEHQEVQCYLRACDYGLLVREPTITNKVASPTKFAEYLACGLSVIISENLGDYSEFVRKNNCGFVLSESGKNTSLSRSGKDAKLRLSELARKNFSKENYREQYQKIV